MKGWLWLLLHARSRRLSRGQTEKEALAVRWAVQRFDEFLRGLQFVVEADHQPLTTLLRDMEVDLLPPRIQHLRLELMRYQFKALYVPAKLLATADTFSRAPLPSSDAAIASLESYMQVVVEAVGESAPVDLETIRIRHKASDGVCSTLVKLCNYGWPSKTRLPANLAAYWKRARGERSVADSLLLKGVDWWFQLPFKWRSYDLFTKVISEWLVLRREPASRYGGLE